MLFSWHKALYKPVKSIFHPLWNADINVKRRHVEMTVTAKAAVREENCILRHDYRRYARQRGWDTYQLMQMELRDALHHAHRTLYTKVDDQCDKLETVVGSTAVDNTRRIVAKYSKSRLNQTLWQSPRQKCPHIRIHPNVFTTQCMPLESVCRLKMS